MKDHLLTGNIGADSFFPLLGILYSRNCLYPVGTEANVQFMTVLNAPTWFLTCLFLTLLIYAGIRKVKEKNEKVGVGLLCVCVLLALVLRYTCPVLLPWSLECALYTTAFLEMGAVARKQKVLERMYERKWVLRPVFVIFVTVKRSSITLNSI